jgi:hypothetical protein
MKKIFIAIFLIFTFCEKEKNIKEEKKWERDKNLRLLIKPEPPFKAYSDAVWSITGKIYYLAAYTINSIRWTKQALKVINEDGTGDKVLLEGEFQCLDISHKYDKLIIGTIDGRLILTDTSGNIIAIYKTIMYSRPDPRHVIVVRFGCGDTTVYYQCVDGNSYKMRLRDSLETQINDFGWMRPDDCEHLPNFETKPPAIASWFVLHPLFDTLFISTYEGIPLLADPIPNGDENEFIIMGSVNKKPITDPKNWIILKELKPYEKSTFYRPNFSYNGKKLIFSAYDGRFEANPGHWWDLAEFLELWVYENFDELIEKYSK